MGLLPRGGGHRQQLGGLGLAAELLRSPGLTLQQVEVTGPLELASSLSHRLAGQLSLPGSSDIPSLEERPLGAFTQGMNASSSLGPWLACVGACPAAWHRACSPAPGPALVAARACPSHPLATVRSLRCPAQRPLGLGTLPSHHPPQMRGRDLGQVLGRLI